MIKEQREKLKIRERSFISIAITEGGVARSVTSVPWVKTANAYRMRTPDVYLSPEDLYDSEVREALSRCKICGCYIYAPLEDYSFLSELAEMQDLNIFNGSSLTNLDFLLKMPKCAMLFLQDASLESLDALCDLKAKSRFALDCVYLENCDVKDLSSIEAASLRFNEFIVSNPKEKDEKARWSFISAYTFKYYAY